MTKIEVCKDRKVENVSSTTCVQYILGNFLETFRGNLRRTKVAI